MHLKLVQRKTWHTLLRWQACSELQTNSRVIVCRINKVNLFLTILSHLMLLIVLCALYMTRV